MPKKLYISKKQLIIGFIISLSADVIGTWIVLATQKAISR